MHDLDSIYDALFAALLELRAEGAEQKNARVFHLADLFHQLPNWLKERDAGEVDADEIVQRLRQRAERAGTSAWLETHLHAQRPTKSLRA